MSRILHPFKGLGEVEFGMTLDQVKTLTGIHNSTVRDRHLKQDQLADGPTIYVFEKGTLATIEVEYQLGIQFNEADLFAGADILPLLDGYKIDRKRDVMHLKELGLVLFAFKAKDVKKRALWLYSREMIPELDNVLDVV